MDIEAVRTFLAIADTGTFQAASERLHVTQSTVSMRIKALEDRLRARLFTRSRAGAELTAEGRRFQRFARAMVLAWERGKQQARIPAEFDSLLCIGGQYALWNALLMPFLPRLRERLPRVALRAEASSPQDLLSRLGEGLLDLAVLYGSDLPARLQATKLLDDELVLVSAAPEGGTDRLVQIEWERGQFDHAEAFDVEAIESGVTIDLGFLSADYLIASEGAGYMPRRMVQAHLAAKKLHIVPGAPAFEYPIFVVYQTRNQPQHVEAAIAELRLLVGQA